MAAPVALPSRWRPLHRGGIIRVRLGCGANFEETLMTDYVPGPGDAWERVDPAAAGADAAGIQAAVDYAIAHDSPMNRDIAAALAGGHFSEPPPPGDIAGPTAPRHRKSVVEGKGGAVWVGLSG